MKIIFVFAAICCLFACTGRDQAGGNPDGGIGVVTTIFPPYDFVRAIAGDNVSLTMLLKPGAESHSYEPSPRDIIAIRDCDLFVYIGGESEAWARRVLASLESGVLAEKRVLRLMDCVEAVPEEIVEGMQEEADGEGGEYDEHIWTSPDNAARMVEAIRAALCDADPAGAPAYTEAAAAYTAELAALDTEFRAAVSGAARRTLVFGDRFPFLYFARAYGLSYYAAFPGCSSETEAGAATLAFLINKVRAEKIPVVFQIEFSSGRMADVISEAAGAQKRLFHSAHNVSRDELLGGTTYLELMKNNLKALREALK